MSADSRVPLLTLAEQYAAPQLTNTVLRDFFGPRSTWQPVAGQLWRAVRDDVTLLMLLLAVDEESVSVVPITVDADDVDADTIVLNETSLGVPVTVWIGLRRSLPVAVLDRPIDQLGQAVLQHIESHAATSEPPAFALVAADVRAELDDDLATLAAAAQQAEHVLADVSSASPPSIDIDALTPEALDQAAARLGQPLPVVLDIIDGKRPASPSDLTVLFETLGGVPPVLTPPASLLVELNQPRWRELIRQHGRQDEAANRDARVALAYDIFAMAARQTGAQAPSWNDRIRRWAQAHHLDADADT